MVDPAMVRALARNEAPIPFKSSMNLYLDSAMNTPTPLSEDRPEPQQPPRSTKAQEAAFDTSRLEVDALRAMLSLPPQTESRGRREDDPEQPHS